MLGWLLGKKIVYIDGWKPAELVCVVTRKNEEFVRVKWSNLQWRDGSCREKEFKKSMCKIVRRNGAFKRWMDNRKKKQK